MPWFFKKNRDREVDEELRAHMAMSVRDRVEGGMSDREARLAARREFGNMTQVQEDTRAVWGSGLLDRFVEDARFAVRLLRRNPVFSAAVVGILALGIGANTAVFSLVNAVMLRSLPVPAPEELVYFKDPGFSYPIFQEVRRRMPDLFDGLFAWTFASSVVEWAEETRYGPVLFATDEFYSTLRVRPALGRTFQPGEKGPVAVISYDCWERRFGRDPAVLGTAVKVDRVPVTIVGVAPAGFYGVAPGLAPEVTIPLEMMAEMQPQEADLSAGGRAWLHFLGRLKAGMSREQANSRLQVVWPQVMETMTPLDETPERRARFLGRKTALEPGRAGFSRVRRQFSEPLLVLLALVGGLLLVACASVANLLLVRAEARRREIAVRFALGASRARILRQLITEGIVLALLGAAAGLVVANWGSGVLVAMLATREDPIQVTLTPDFRVLGFALAASLVTAVVFTLAPAVRVTGLAPGPVLKESARSVAAGGNRWSIGRLLVVVQLCLAMLLLAGGALFTGSLRHLMTLDAGFDSDKLLVADPGALAGYSEARRWEYYRQLRERLGRVPGVESVSLSWVPPLSDQMGNWSTHSIGVDGTPVRNPGRVYFNSISPGYFATIGQRLLRGRDFGPQDRASAVRTCIITESFARDFFPSQEPLGRHVGAGLAGQDLEIVGIVRNAKYQNLQEETSRIVYVPYEQVSSVSSGDMPLVAEIRSRVTPSSLRDPLRRELRAIDPELPVQLATMPERVRESIVTERVVAVISAFLGGVALLLASAGLYGLMAFNVAQRTGEIGIRMALGASQWSVVRMVLGDSMLMVAVGLGLGIAASLALGRFAANLLYGLTPSDPAALSVAGAVLLLVAIAAACGPARRAARIDPVIALRQE